MDTHRQKLISLPGYDQHIPAGKELCDCLLKAFIGMIKHIFHNDPKQLHATVYMLLFISLSSMFQWELNNTPL